MSLNLKVIIAESFLRLCETKPPRKITVQDIVNESGVSRQSFYNHFPCRDDLYSWIFKRHMEEYEATIGQADKLEVSTRKHYEIFQKYRRFYRGIASTDMNDPFLSFLYYSSFDLYVTYICKRLGVKDLGDDLLFSIKFVIYGCTTSYVEWILSEHPCSPEVMARRICDSMPSVIWQFYER